MQSSILFDYQSAKKEPEQKTEEGDFSWAVHLQIAVLENNKSSTASKIIKSNFDRFNSFLIYVKDYNSAATTRDSLPEKIKQKLVLIANTFQLE